MAAAQAADCLEGEHWFMRSATTAVLAPVVEVMMYSSVYVCVCVWEMCTSSFICGSGGGATGRGCGLGHRWTFLSSAVVWSLEITGQVSREVFKWIYCVCVCVCCECVKVVWDMRRVPKANNQGGDGRNASHSRGQVMLLYPLWSLVRWC